MTTNKPADTQAYIAELEAKLSDMTDDYMRRHKEAADYAIENSELKTKLEKAREALTSAREATGHDDCYVCCGIVSYKPHRPTCELTEALALLDSPNVVAEIKAAVLREAAKWFNDHVDNRLDTWQAEELRRMANELLKEKQG